MVRAWKCDFSLCGHVWMSPTEPSRCAKCKRPKWNKSGEGKLNAKLGVLVSMNEDGNSGIVAAIPDELLKKTLTGKRVLVPHAINCRCWQCKA